ncbi:hypothetical protein L249_0182 [Ophiocordyceps polyrhachis-furcata BCC 54312]|uniref:Peptidyl-tRNA hydrolase n=1 Tax=Ophiocordyceps polyrhachis-furcata BCC 54312 TaxID=1330021 RepID=A0A367LDC7_9HYPO|nr:hypothetical protein L249_0182 [Ophiocordyceps polyrhachis-furcata BCC 54312]
MSGPHFLVVSLGNPLPKYDTLHSAAHYVARLGNLPSCNISRGVRHTLIQSPVLMNVSGSFVSHVWRHFCQQRRSSSSPSLGLVLVHDELESAEGVVSVLSWSRSARGHRGVKDAQARVPPEVSRTSPLARIAVGIGRPEQRDVSTVVNFVMSRIPNSFKTALEGPVALQVACYLQMLEDCWKTEVESGRRDPGLGWTERITKNKKNP